MLGTLGTVAARTRTDLLAPPVARALAAWPVSSPLSVDTVHVAPIDPELADTAAFCAAYEVGLADSANCVVVCGKRDGEVRYAACLVLATTRADVNGVVRRQLDVRKASFAPMDDAVSLTGMEYGGITPIGLPRGWPILVDSAVAAATHVVIGSGLRRSKIVAPGLAVASLPGALIIERLGLTPVTT